MALRHRQRQSGTVHDISWRLIVLGAIGTDQHAPMARIAAVTRTSAAPSRTAATAVRARDHGPGGGEHDSSAAGRVLAVGCTGFFGGLLRGKFVTCRGAINHQYSPFSDAVRNQHRMVQF